jgi:hypothetical protein
MNPNLVMYFKFGQVFLGGCFSDDLFVGSCEKRVSVNGGRNITNLLVYFLHAIYLGGRTGICKGELLLQYPAKREDS